MISVVVQTFQPQRALLKWKAGKCRSDTYLVPAKCCCFLLWKSTLTVTDLRSLAVQGHAAGAQVMQVTCPFNKTDKQSCTSRQVSVTGPPVTSRGSLDVSHIHFSYPRKEIWWLLFKWLVSVSSFYRTKCLSFGQEKFPEKRGTGSFTQAFYGTSNSMIN